MAHPMTTTTTSRHGFVDALRGFALLGILLVNVEYIVQPLELGWVGYEGRGDQVVRWLVVTFGQMKVYPLFALLFGYGLSIQVANAARRNVELAPAYRRRMVGIGCLGVLHGVLFFPGDILVLYAAIGALAFRFRAVDTPRLVRWSIAVYGAAAALWLAVGLLDLLGSPGTPTASADTVDTLTNGSFLEVVGVHFWEWLITLGILTMIQGPAVFASFLLGIVLGRTDLLSDPDRHRDLALRVLRWAPLGLAGAGVGASMTVVGGRWDTLGFAIGFAAAPLVAAAYLAGLALVLSRGSSPLSTLLEASGRMSLTIYLAESIVVSTLSYGYGFGWFATVGPAEGVLIAVAVWVGLSGLAFGWMRMARFGPSEWALRSFTHRTWQPLRK